LSILEASFGQGVSDAKMLSRYQKVASEGLGAAAIRGMPERARDLATRLSNMRRHFGLQPVSLWGAERCTDIFSSDAELISLLEDFVRKGTERGVRLVEEETDQMGRAGVVLRIAEGLPYGFIRGDDTKDWFFHQNHMVTRSDWSELKEGERVEFVIGSNNSGPCAVEVRREGRK
jgi:cold shock CspA family protein